MVKRVSLLTMFALFAACQSKPNAASPYEREVLRRTDLQLAGIQKEFQAQFDKVTQPIIKERDDMRVMVCGRAKLALDVCVIDLANGSVTKKVSDAGKK